MENSTFNMCIDSCDKINSSHQPLDLAAASLTVTSTPTKDYNNEGDSDDSALQIILPSSGKKRKRAVDIEREIEDDIEMALETKQKKTNLTVKNVKSILRYVIENENVLAMINNSMKESGLEIEPKITRSKARQLREGSQIIWPLSPIPAAETDTTEKEHLVLINEELPEEEDDEEYNPTLEDLHDHSDDESGRQSVGTPSLDQSTAGRYLECFDPGLLDDNFGNQNVDTLEPGGATFKKPLGPQKPESIGQRTRSKYSLSQTPLETIEQAFIPPDITTDMYDFKCGDQEWENFLTEFMLPLPSDAPDADEDDDPEYNAMAEVEQIDKEELRRDRAVKVSRAEVRRLMEELAGCADEASSDDDDRAERAPVPADPAQQGIVAIEARPPTPPSPEPKVIGMTSVQAQLLMQQTRQHVQLLTQGFLQVHCHPVYSELATRYKSMLAELIELIKEHNNQSVLNVFNLMRGFELVEGWEKIMMTQHGKDIIDHMIQDAKIATDAKKRKLLHQPSFPKLMMKLLVNSKVFMYPGLLPHQPLRCDGSLRLDFTEAEDHLIASGLQQLLPLATKYPRWCDAQQGSKVASAADLIHELIMPVRQTKSIRRRIRRVKNIEGNPIWHYMTYGNTPQTKHYLVALSLDQILAPKDQPLTLLPPCWAEYVKFTKKSKKKSVVSCEKECEGVDVKATENSTSTDNL